MILNVSLELHSTTQQLENRINLHAYNFSEDRYGDLSYDFILAPLSFLVDLSLAQGDPSTYPHTPSSEQDYETPADRPIQSIIYSLVFCHITQAPPKLVGKMKGNVQR